MIIRFLEGDSGVFTNPGNHLAGIGQIDLRIGSQNKLCLQSVTRHRIKNQISQSPGTINKAKCTYNYQGSSKQRKTPSFIHVTIPLEKRERFFTARILPVILGIGRGG
jgi:hypothetical protein